MLVSAASWALALAAGAASAQTVTSESLDACRAAVERQRYEDDAAEFPRAADVCPDVVAAVAASDWAAALFEREAAELPPAALLALATLAARYESAAAEPGVRLDTLDSVLEAVHVPEESVERSLWERFTGWLRDFFGRNGGSSSWLTDWLENLSLPERILRVVVIAIGVVLVIATFAIVINELRQAGVFRRRAGAASSADGASAFDDEPRVRSLADVSRAPLARQPALLLALVLDGLRRRIPVAASTTHRDLLAVSAALRPAERAPFGRVVTVAERATFGGWMPAPAETEALLETGARLLESLAAPDEEVPAAPAGSTPPAAAPTPPAESAE